MTSEGFSNSIVAGVGALVRAYIKSPDYVPGVSGWAIFKDGSAEFNNITIRATLQSANFVHDVSGWQLQETGHAEFNDVDIRDTIESPNYVAGATGWHLDKNGNVEFNSGTFRGQLVITSAGVALLEYDGTPRLGNLVLALSPTAGSDSFGNSFSGGITLSQESGQAGLDLIWQNSAGGNTEFRSPRSGAVGDETFVIFHNPVGAYPFQIAPVGASTGLQIGAGLAGKYYAEQVFLTAQVIATGGALKAITAFTAGQRNSDYGSQFNLATGVWTCPAKGWYQFTFHNRYTGWVAGSNSENQISNNTSGETYPFGCPSRNSGRITQSPLIFCTLNDSLSFSVFQDTGANQTLSTASFITVRRCL